jgi:hypothetical protein
MMLLEPSIVNALNLEASSYYNSDLTSFEQQVQRTLQGCIFKGVTFPSVINVECSFCRRSPNSTVHAMRNVMEVIPNDSPIRRKRRDIKREDSDEEDRGGEDDQVAGYLGASKSTTVTARIADRGLSQQQSLFAHRDCKGESLKKRVKAEYEDVATITCFDELSIENENNISIRW